MELKRINLPVMGQRPEPAAPPAPEVPPGATLEERVVATLQTIYDPELPVSIHDLGLIYRLAVSPEGAVAIDMTLTAPNCPVAGAIVSEVQRKVAAVPGVTSSKVELVWDPPWTRGRMSEEAALTLGLD
ncbi:MAG: iron-sulfur cluster assembly protein [Gemmataceae bacterium]